MEQDSLLQLFQRLSDELKKAFLNSIMPNANSDQSIVQIAQPTLARRLYGTLMGEQAPTAFADYNGWAQKVSSDGKVTRQELNEGSRLFGWNKNLKRAIGADLNGKGNGAATRRMVKGLQKRHYVKDGKLISEGDPTFTDNDFMAAIYKGTDSNDIVGRYNTDVTNWRNNATITYRKGNDGKYHYYASGKLGNEDRNDVDITDSDWFKNDTDRQRSILEKAYYDAVNNFNRGALSAYSAANLANTLKFNPKVVAKFKTSSKAGKEKFKTNATAELLKYIDKLRTSSDGNYNFEGNVTADAILRYLLSNPVEWLNPIALDAEGIYERTRKKLQLTGDYNLLAAKNGAVMRYIKKHAIGSTINGTDVKFGSDTLSWLWGENFIPSENAYGKNFMYKPFGGNDAEYYLYRIPNHENGYLYYNPSTNAVHLASGDKFDNLGVYLGDASAGTDSDLEQVWNSFMNNKTEYNRWLSNPSKYTKENNSDKKDTTFKDKKDKKSKRGRTSRINSGEYNGESLYAKGGNLNSKLTVLESLNRKFFLKGGRLIHKAFSGEDTSKWIENDWMNAARDLELSNLKNLSLTGSVGNNIIKAAVDTYNQTYGTPSAELNSARSFYTGGTKGRTARMAAVTDFLNLLELDFNNADTFNKAKSLFGVSDNETDTLLRNRFLGYVSNRRAAQSAAKDWFKDKRDPTTGKIILGTSKADAYAAKQKETALNAAKQRAVSLSNVAKDGKISYTYDGGVQYDGGSENDMKTALGETTFNDRLAKAKQLAFTDAKQGYTNIFNSGSETFKADSSGNFTGLDGVKRLQEFIGTTADGKWGRDSQNTFDEFIGKIQDPAQKALLLEMYDTYARTNVYNGKYKNKPNNYGFSLREIDNIKTGTSDITTTYNKKGGILNMNKINYFQAGGAMAPAQAAPAASPEQGGQDIQAQVVQLVQAAMSGDEKATLTIQQIMQAAQLGDQLAAQIAQMILEVAQQMLGQALAAKRGAKLSYIKSLKTGCPEGYEVSYHREGGKVCKECIAKNALNNASKNSEVILSEPIFFNKCGGKAKKGEMGINLGDNKTKPVLKKTPVKSLPQPQKRLDPNNTPKLPGGKYPTYWTPDLRIAWERKYGKNDEGTASTDPIKKNKCGGKTKKAACGSKLKKSLKYGGKKCEDEAVVEKCGGKAKCKKNACGGVQMKPKAACGKALNEKCGGKTKKKCAEGGILNIENLLKAFMSIFK